MHIPCIATETAFDVQCPVCGRGFLLLTEPTLSLQRGSMRRHARRALAAQHDQPLASSGNVHSDEVFDLPGWDGEPEGSSVALDFTATLRLQTTH
ncbi:hypothetical protein [Terriglobus roseus]|uniref:Uncharacterized protein n=1 Tax=Terriglobus roseus TaxID=392734 RepID=A0A1G7PTR0_9BACT|nr:hypothetical protein [Terriglobus roseus]SDF89634.1 hypothetical protein SAMN05444167_3622 [Terriglobus roseus]